MPAMLENKNDMKPASPKEPAEPGERRGRKASKEIRRQQLIEATIDSLARRGYSETTMADVADGAGLSRGIVNFHFESKEKLLVATLQHMYEEYSAHWRNALQRAGDDPAEQLKALVAADFDRAICDPPQARRLVRLLGRGEVASDLSGAVRGPRRRLPGCLRPALHAARRGGRLSVRAAGHRAGADRHARRACGCG